MNSFSLTIPTRIYFGDGILQEAIQKEAFLLSRRTLVVMTGDALRKLGCLDTLLTAGKKAGVLNDYIAFDRITPNPKLDEIREGIAVGKDRDVSCVIGFGGGSAMDAAKAIAVGLASPDPIEEYLFSGKAPLETTLPIIAIPTTAGTGSELSKGAIISSPEHRIKTGIRGDHILPAAAIVEPRFTYRLPREFTMETGFDVFSHAFESYISKSATAFSEMLSESAIKIVAKYLPALANNLEDEQARQCMSFASMMMGVNLANTGTALPHRMQYPIGAITDTGHAAGLIALYPAWMDYSYAYSKDKFIKVAEWISGKACKSKADALGAIHGFMNQLGLRRTLKDLGVKPDSEEELADLVSGNLSADPVAAEKDVIAKIYRKSI